MRQIKASSKKMMSVFNHSLIAQFKVVKHQYMLDMHNEHGPRNRTKNKKNILYQMLTDSCVHGHNDLSKNSAFHPGDIKCEDK